MCCARLLKVSFFVVLVFWGFMGYGQNLPVSAHTGYFHWYFNPAFSTAHVNRHQVFANYRSQSNNMDNTQSYLFLGYSGASANSNSNYNFALSQERVGVLRHVGVNANYAYGIRLGDNSKLSMGILANFYHSSLATDDLILTNPDDEWLYTNYRNRYILDFMPGININLNNWDVGFAMRNFYSVSKNGENTTSPEEAFMGNLSYAINLNSDGVLKDAYFRPMVLAAYYPSGIVDLQASLLLQAPNMGHLGFAYSNERGWSANLGFNLSRKIRVMYAYQMGENSFNGNPNTIHEMGLVYTIQNKGRAVPQDSEDAMEETIDVFEAKKEELELTAADRRAQAELAKMREEMERQDEVLEQKATAKQVNVAEEDRAYWVVNRNKLNQPKVEVSEEQTAVQEKMEEPKITPPVKKEVVSTPKKTAKKPSPLKHKRNGHVKPGHYIIASSFKEVDNAVKYANEMAQKGYKTERIFNPDRNYYYVAVGHYDTKEGAKQAIRSLVYKRFEGVWVYSLE